MNRSARLAANRLRGMVIYALNERSPMEHRTITVRYSSSNFQFFQALLSLKMSFFVEID
jgi:hypothetical protein